MLIKKKKQKNIIIPSVRKEWIYPSLIPKQSSSSWSYILIHPYHFAILGKFTNERFHHISKIWFKLISLMHYGNQLNVFTLSTLKGFQLLNPWSPDWIAEKPEYMMFSAMKLLYLKNHLKSCIIRLFYMKILGWPKCLLS